tara:strand:- start:72 stop:287 length:216 start_codon:yes stop_codon:yes gene_type:complete
MFKIFASICFLSVGATNQTLCFKSEVPLRFDDEINCRIARDTIVEFMHEDLVERETTILFQCQKELEQLNI